MVEVVVFLQFRVMLSEGAQDFREDVSVLPISLNKGIMGWGSTK